MRICRLEKDSPIESKQTGSGRGKYRPLDPRDYIHSDQNRCFKAGCLGSHLCFTTCYLGI